MLNREKVKDITISKIREYTSDNTHISENTKIIEDLGIIGDDASEIILRIQEVTGSKPPIKMWRKVETVGEIINLIVMYLPESKSS